MDDDERIAYLSGDDAVAPDIDERAELDELRGLLADPALWSDPAPELEQRVVTAIADAAAGARTRLDDGPVRPPTIGRTPSTGPVRRPRTGRLLAAAAVLVLAVGVTATLVSRRPSNGERFTAALAPPAGSASTARGSATMERTTSGWRIELDASDLPRLDGGRFYQAWLRSDAGVLVPIGTFNEGERVVLWAGVSPRDFPLLTVTEEQADGDQASSGVRVLAGTSSPGG